MADSNGNGAPSPAERRALLAGQLRLEGYTHREIAGRLGVSEGCGARYLRNRPTTRAAHPARGRLAALRMVRTDVEQQLTFDAERAPQALLAARARAVVVAQRAMASGEIGGRESLRQALVDLAAAGELAAAAMDVGEVDLEEVEAGA